MYNMRVYPGEDFLAWVFYLEKGGSYEETSYLCIKTMAILVVCIGLYVYCNWIRYVVPAGDKDYRKRSVGEW